MGERKGTNKYYPPDFDPRLHRSLDAYHGTHALRERAKKIGQGIIVIRFEMPYNIWCGGCGRHVAMGVRYNAEKKKVGMYFSTPIYEFNMKCHLCDQRYLIRTDPANYDYVIVSGARRKEQRWDPTENGQIAPEDGETKRRLATDAMYKLEYGKSDEERGADVAPRLAALAGDTAARGANDIQLNRLIRAGLREERKRLAAESASDADFLARHSLIGGSLELLPESAADEIGAQLLHMDSVVPLDAVRPTKRKISGGVDRHLSDDSSPFKMGRPVELDDLRRRTGQNRRLMGIVVGGRGSNTSSAMSSTSSTSATSSMVDGSATSSTSSTSAASSVVDGSATSSTSSTSATSSMVDVSATSSMVDSSATSSMVDGSAKSSMVDGSATSSMVDGSAKSSVVDGSATSSVVDGSATSSMFDGSATSSMVDGSAKSSKVDASATSSILKSNNESPNEVVNIFGGGLVQYSATPSPASSDASVGDDK